MERNDLELKLIQRLRNLGILLCIFSFLAVIYTWLPLSEEKKIDQLLFSKMGVIEKELVRPLNPFIVAGVFCFVGTACILSARKRHRTYLSSNPPS